MFSFLNNQLKMRSTKLAMLTKLFGLILVLLLFVTSHSMAQCTVTLTNNSNYTLPTNNNNAVICVNVNGARSGSINLGANTGVTIVISSITIFTGTISQSGSAAFRVEVNGRIRGDRTFSNSSRLVINSGGQYDDNGTLTLSNGILEVRSGGTIARPITANSASSITNLGAINSNITLNNTSTFTNSGTQSGNLTLTNGSTSTNSGTITGNISLNSTSNFTNSGTQSGSLTLSGSGRVTNSGTLTISSFSNTSGSQLTNTSTGTITIDQNSDLTISGPINNQGIFRFESDERNVTIASGVTISNTGTFEVGRDFINDGIFNSANGVLSVERNLINDGTLTLGTTNVGRDFINEETATSTGTLTVGRDLINDGTINLSNTVVERDFTNDGTTTLAGSLEVGDDLRNENDGIIRPLNANQCNTIFVTDDFENQETNGITGGNLSGPFKAPLLVNKAPSDRGITDGALVDSSLDCSCGNTFSNTGSFTVPAGVTQLTIKGWGGGGRGGNRDRNSGTSGGGGAGAYSESTIAVTPGEVLYFSAGAGSNSNAPGGDSWISRNANGSNPILLAKGGNSAGINSSSGAKGGLASQGIGTIKSNGGDGANAGSNGGRGGNSPNGGQGGQGGTSSNSDGANGINPGGGGGGAKTNGNGNSRNGGNGGTGQITFSYNCGGTVTPPSNGCWRYIDDGSVSGTVIIEFFEDCTWNAPTGLLEFEVLAIGGGGGGGVRSGGGGGGGGAVHARAMVDARLAQGLPEGSSFEIKIGNGGKGSTTRNRKGEDGGITSFDADGLYEIQAGGGGGGGSHDNNDNDDDDNDDSNQRDGNPGIGSSFNSTTQGYTIVASTLFGGAGGGGGHDGDGGPANARRGGDADDHAGAGGGGLGGNQGANALNDNRGGNGANGRQFSRFDITLNRFFGAGGGGGSRDNFTANGGNSNAGGNGGRGDGDNASNGTNGTTPGSGGGGSGHDAETVGGDGAKGVVIVRYEIARILPVEFMSFRATYDQQSRQGVLNWATAKEWENSHFEVERSVNDVKNWKKIGEVAGVGYSDKKTEYMYLDKEIPAAGGNVFYRLKQINYNGDHSYSVTKAIQVDALKGSSSWIIYPNPTTGRNFKLALIESEKRQEGRVEARISPTSGQMEFFSDSDIDMLSERIGSYLQTKSPGVYILQLTWNSKTESLRIIKN